MPVGPLDVKSYQPPKSYWPEMFFIDKQPTIVTYISHYKSKNASLDVIYFAVGELLSRFQSVFGMADSVAAGIV